MLKSDRQNPLHSKVLLSNVFADKKKNMCLQENQKTPCLLGPFYVYVHVLHSLEDFVGRIANTCIRAFNSGLVLLYFHKNSSITTFMCGKN